MGRIIAIDYGLKRTGLAVTDTEKIIASPLTVVPSADCIQFLKDYMREEEVETIVVGMPVDLKSRETHATDPVRKFVKELEIVFKEISIFTIDDVGSSCSFNVLPIAS